MSENTVITKVYLSKADLTVKGMPAFLHGSFELPFSDACEKGSDISVEPLEAPNELITCLPSGELDCAVEW